jgi:hypothetical protein
MDGDICPGELGLKVGFKMISKIMALQNRNITGHDKVKLDKDLGPVTAGL